jgi:hypothetical protein
MKVTDVGIVRVLVFGDIRVRIWPGTSDILNSVLSGACQIFLEYISTVSQLVNDRFLPNSFQLIIRQSPCHSMLYSAKCKVVPVLN